MMSVVFILLAAICKAVSDTLAHHFATSVFRWKDPRFWNPEVSWQAPLLKGTKYRLDAWHLANSGMIVFFCAAVVFHRSLVHWSLELLIAGILFNLCFNLFYNKIFR